VKVLQSTNSWNRPSELYSGIHYQCLYNARNVSRNYRQNRICSCRI